MMYILYGSDSFLRELYVKDLSKKFGVVKTTYAISNLPAMEELLGGDLFGGRKLFVLETLLQSVIADAKVLDRIKKSPNYIVFTETALDKRLTTTKVLLGDKDIIAVECKTPDGQELVGWIVERAKSLDGDIAPPTAKILAERMGAEFTTRALVNTEHRFTLATVNTELQKLVTYAAGNLITAEAIELLVPKAREVTGFEIINAIGEKQQAKVAALLEQFYAQDGEGDDKVKTIQFTSLLADQFRSILVVQDFVGRRMSDSAILTATKWKPGRLFIMKKLAGKFSSTQVLETLGKLENLDIEVKSSSVPPQVLVNLILASL